MSDDALESPTPIEESVEQGGATIAQLQEEFDATYNGGETAPTEEATAAAPEVPPVSTPDPIAALSAEIAALKAQLAAPPATPTPDIMAEVNKDERVTRLDSHLTEVAQIIENLKQTKVATQVEWTKAHETELRLRGQLETADEVDKDKIERQLDRVVEYKARLQTDYAGWDGQIAVAQANLIPLSNERGRLVEALKAERYYKTQEQAEKEADVQLANEGLIQAVQTACAKATPGQLDIIAAYTRANVVAEIRRGGQAVTVETVTRLAEHFAEQGAKELGIRAAAAKAKIEVSPQRNLVSVGSSRPTTPVKDAAYWDNRAKFLVERSGGQW